MLLHPILKRNFGKKDNIMTSKIFYISIFLICLLGCNTGNKKEIISEAVVDSNYKLIKYSKVSHFKYTPQNKDSNLNATEDFIFSKELLYSLESSLTEFNYDISICDETIKTNLNDTINLTIYDFINSGNKDKISNLFKDTMFYDKFIGLYEAPVICKFIISEENLCSICTGGISFPDNIRNDQLIEYIKQNTKQRLQRK